MRKALGLSLAVALGVFLPAALMGQAERTDSREASANRLLGGIVGQHKGSSRHGVDVAANAMASQWTSEVSPIGDSGWVVMKSKGTSGNKSYESVAIWGYDGRKGKFRMMGVNTLFPSRAFDGEGTYDEATKTISWDPQEVIVPGTNETALHKHETRFQADGTVVAIEYIKRPGAHDFVKWSESTTAKRAQ
jgi:hypothetical protein